MEPRDRIYVKNYGLSFAKNIGTHATKVAKNMSNKYRQKTFNSAKKVFHNKYFKISKGISFKGISSKRISFNNRCWWDKNAKRKIYISRKKIIDEL